MLRVDFDAEDFERVLDAALLDLPVFERDEAGLRDLPATAFVVLLLGCAHPILLILW